MQGLVQGLSRGWGGDGPGQNLPGGHRPTVKGFVDARSGHNDFPIEGYARVQTLGQTVRVNGCRSGGRWTVVVIVVVLAQHTDTPVAFDGPTQRSDGNANVRPQLYRCGVAVEEGDGGIGHEQKDVIRNLRPDQCPPRHTRRTDGTRCTPAKVVVVVGVVGGWQSCHDETGSELDTGQSEAPLDDRQNGHTLGLCQ